MEAKLIKTEVNYLLENEEGVIIASTSLKKEGLALSLKNCQAIERGYDLDELRQKAYEKYDKDNLSLDEYIQRSGGFLVGYEKGLQKALEILGDKKFTYNQMVSAITESSISHRLPSLIIQDLQQTEWDVEIVMACVIGCENLILNGENSLCCGNKKPKLDADNNLILKRK